MKRAMVIRGVLSNPPRSLKDLLDGFRGFTLTIHCEDEEAVVQAHQQLREFDDVADLDLDDRGGFIYP